MRIDVEMMNGRFLAAALVSVIIGSVLLPFAHSAIPTWKDWSFSQNNEQEKNESGPPSEPQTGDSAQTEGDEAAAGSKPAPPQTITPAVDDDESGKAGGAGERHEVPQWKEQDTVPPAPQKTASKTYMAPVGQEALTALI